MQSIFRFFYIIYTFCYFRLFDLLKTLNISKSLKFIIFFIPQSFSKKKIPLPKRLRLALESLGPIYVKFGQILSTRPDIIPDEYIKELNKLQDDVKPFTIDIAIKEIEQGLNNKLENIFFEFDENAIASASVAQVYKAYLYDNNKRGQKVAVKILRPNIERVISKDLSLMYSIASILGKVFKDSTKRLKLIEVIDEFKKYLYYEIDLMNEAVNLSIIKSHFENSSQLLVPEVYMDYCNSNLLVLEWMDGIRVSDINKLKEKNIDLKKIAVFGVEIFFTQVFKFGFFHADMHPGNILISDDGRYIGIDFGIVGSLTEFDKRYLAINLLAFFNRDYHKVAVCHLESGWVPANTNILDLEYEIRRVCEPFFKKPLYQISFGRVLLNLFEVSRKFNVEIQPQLVLLQKTLLNVEGLGRQLDPELNLWDTAKPFLEKWISEQIGFNSLLKNIKKEMMDWSIIFPELPRRFYNYLNNNKNQVMLNNLSQITKNQKFINIILILIVFLLIILNLIYVFN